MKKRIKRLWAGDLPLAEAVWEYAVWYGVLLNFATSVLFLAFMVNQAGPVMLFLVFLLPIPYNLLVVVAVWRSAGRYQGPRKWADLARFGTVIWMIALTAA